MEMEPDGTKYNDTFLSMRSLPNVWEIIFITQGFCTWESSTTPIFSNLRMLPVGILIASSWYGIESYWNTNGPN